MSILKMSKVYCPTLKEDPTEAEIASHRLLLRAGMIRKVGSGIYTFLPLGKKVLAKVENIIREEMETAGAQEVMMPVLQPAELWHESGRWDDYGPELMRLDDRHEHGFCLGPTHEELITALVRDELKSYRQLPACLYQIQVKFRDEMRPRFGLLRTREFIMKDAYSFHASQESLQETYEAMEAAYARICERMGLKYRKVEADSGQIGGSVTCEFMALADAGESDLVHCECGFAADAEAAQVALRSVSCEARELERIATPGVTTIAQLAEFLDVPESMTVKALAGQGDDGVPTVLFIPGDHELNDIKAERVVSGFALYSDDALRAQHLVKGFMGPVGLPAGVRVIADSSLRDRSAWTVGANDEGFHCLGAQPQRDFSVDVWADLVLARPGDLCPLCGKPLKGDRGIEVSQVFQLGTKYSQSMGATYMAEDGSEQPFIMGCYGIGVTRSLAAAVEQGNDDAGIVWPVSIAPAEVCIVPLQMGDDLVEPLAESLAEQLNARGIEVVIDDRSDRAGVKFADADLIGWPYQIVVGKRGASQGNVEFKRRATQEKVDVAVDDVVALAADAVISARGALSAGASL